MNGKSCLLGPDDESEEFGSKITMGCDKQRYRVWISAVVMVVSGRTYDSRGLTCRSIDETVAGKSSCIDDDDDPAAAIAPLYMEDIGVLFFGTIVPSESILEESDPH